MNLIDQDRSARRIGELGARVAGCALVCAGMTLWATAPAQAISKSATSEGSVQVGVPLPYLQQSDCSSGSTLYTHPPGPLMLNNPTIETGITVPAGTLSIDRYWSWDGHDDRADQTQANEQWALTIGGTTSPLTADLPDGVTSVLVIGSLGSFSVPGGSIRIVHSSQVGPTDGSPNSVYPWGFCYRTSATETTTPSDTTLPADTTKPADTTRPSDTTKPDDTTIPQPTVATTVTTQPPKTTASIPTNLNTSLPPINNPDPTPTTARVTTAPPTTAPATTASPSTTPPTIATTAAVSPTTAPTVQVLAGTVEEEATEDLSYTGPRGFGGQVAVSCTLILSGLAMLGATRRLRGLRRS
jgi:hypothetical protein